MINMNEVPHTQRKYGLQYHYSLDDINPDGKFKESLDNGEEKAVWQIKIPGINPETVEAYVLGNRVKVKISHEGRDNSDYITEFLLAHGEYPIGVSISLGIMSIYIDKPHKIDPLTIDWER